MEEILGAFASEGALNALSEMLNAVNILISTIGYLVPLATYVLVAYSLFRIAKRRGIRNPWMAFVPVVQLWLLGSISDDYQMKVHGAEKKRRKILLGLQIAKAALAVVLVIMILVAVFAILSAGYTYYDDIGDWIGVIGSIGGLILLVLGVAGVSLAVTILRYMALYDVYRSCEPANAVLFVVLNIFIAITQPILLFVCRNKDEGMPKITEPAEPWEI